MNTDEIKIGGPATEEYIKPQIEVIEIDTEGSILAASGGPGFFMDGGGWSSLGW